MTRRSFSSLTEIARHRAEQQPDRNAYGEWGDHDVSSWLSYRQLDQRARAIAAALQQNSAPGERALLLYPPGFDYLAAFFGCLYANVIAVPAYPPEPTRLERTLPRLQAIVADAQASLILTTGEIGRLVGEQVSGLSGLRCLATDELRDGDAWRPMETTPDTIAFLQYTSGSTGLPKGVVITHGNLLHNSVAVQKALGSTPDTLKVSWVPPYHDMGLIGCIVQAMFVGFPLVSLPALSFLFKPFRWLQAISHTRANISGAPNFALDLCVQKVGAEQRARLDLRCWKSLYVSAEPIRSDTLERFAAAFSDCGFDRSAFYPTYGLAEATLVVSGGLKGSGARSTPFNDLEVVSVGPNLAPGGEIAIVDADTRSRLGEERIGEIWVRSGSVARGYWNRPEESEECFGARTEDGGGPWLRTGDSGFLRGGELYISGRLKEVIIIRGRKHFPSDLEDTLERIHWQAAHYRAGGTAAFSLRHDGEERLGVAVEVERRRRERRGSAQPADERRRGRDRRARPFQYKADAEPAGFDDDGVVRAIRCAIASAHGIEPWAVVLLRPGAIPKTSSGKKQRLLCRALYLGEAGLDEAAPRDVLHRWYADGAATKKLRLA